jgi:hypothetical protein
MATYRITMDWEFDVENSDAREAELKEGNPAFHQAMKEYIAECVGKAEMIDNMEFEVIDDPKLTIEEALEEANAHTDDEVMDVIRKHLEELESDVSTLAKAQMNHVSLLRKAKTHLSNLTMFDHDNAGMEAKAFLEKDLKTY